MKTELVVVGMSYKTAPLELRERLAFDGPELDDAVVQLAALPSVGEVVLLSTCNRVEVYAASPEPAAAAGEIRRFLAAAKQLDDEKLAGHLYEHAGEPAVTHVFRVASSLDSLVIGESQILGQLKSAYGAATKVGAVGPILGRCLERAFGVAKRVRSETGIARGAANISTVAVELAKRVFGELAGKIVLVVGAGKMSDLAARHLRADGAAEIFVTNRSPERAEELARKVEGKARAWDELEKLLAGADVVISSTGSKQPIITRALMKQVMKARRHRPIFLIDIAVPRDVEAGAGKLDGVYLFDIDDLERVVADNRKERAGAAADAVKIVDHEVGQFETWLRGQGVVPTIQSLRQRFERAAQLEAEKTIVALKLDGKQADAIRQMADAIVSKLLHAPLMALKRVDEGEVEMMIQATHRLFELSEPPLKKVESK